MRRAQLSFGDGLIAEEISDLRDDWMQYADQVLADEALVTAVYEALGRRHPKSKSRGRLGAPADMVLRLLILKHIRNWSYDVLEREVRANLVGLYPRGRQQDAGRQDHGPLGDGAWTAGAQASSRADRNNSLRQRHHRRTPHAFGHHGG